MPHRVNAAHPCKPQGRAALVLALYVTGGRGHRLRVDGRPRILVLGPPVILRLGGKPCIPVTPVECVLTAGFLAKYRVAP